MLHFRSKPNPPCHSLWELCNIWPLWHFVCRGMGGDTGSAVGIWGSRYDIDSVSADNQTAGGSGNAVVNLMFSVSVGRDSMGPFPSESATTSYVIGLCCVWWCCVCQMEWKPCPAGLQQHCAGPVLECTHGKHLPDWGWARSATCFKACSYRAVFCLLQFSETTVISLWCVQKIRISNQNLNWYQGIFWLNHVWLCEWFSLGCSHQPPYVLITSKTALINPLYATCQWLVNLFKCFSAL